MKIVLVVTNPSRKSLVFVSKEIDAYPLEEAVKLAREGKIDGAHVVQGKKSGYIRTNPKVAKSEEFDTLSVTIGNLLLFAHGIHITKVSPVLNAFVELYRSQLEKNGQLIKPVEQPEVLAKTVKEKLQQNRSFIFNAAEKFEIDPYLIGAILIDEIARLHPFEAILDIVGVQIIGGNTSIGIAQVKTDTANSIINLGLYNPNPKDSKLPFKRLDRIARVHLYSYLIQPKHNIFFAAAVIRDTLDSWIRVAGDKLTPAEIATLYSKGGKPHSDPTSNARGEQIAGEFYGLAKTILK